MVLSSRTVSVFSVCLCIEPVSAAAPVACSCPGQAAAGWAGHGFCSCSGLFRAGLHIWKNEHKVIHFPSLKLEFFLRVFSSSVTFPCSGKSKQAGDCCSIPSPLQGDGLYVTVSYTSLLEKTLAELNQVCHLGLAALPFGGRKGLEDDKRALLTLFPMESMQVASQAYAMFFCDQASINMLWTQEVWGFSCCQCAQRAVELHGGIFDKASGWPV